MMSKKFNKEAEMTKEPEINRELIEDTIPKRADELEKSLWSSSSCKNYKEHSEALECAFSSLIFSAALALYCLEKNLDKEFYEKAQEFIHSGLEEA